jgi:2-hydroxychromene-2-carboxylate isomerase
MFDVICRALSCIDGTRHRYIGIMQFDGQVWFSFRNPEVWIFYRFLRKLAASGESVNLQWVPLFDPDEENAMTTFLAIKEAEERGRFLHAMLGLIHLEREPFDDASIVAKALSAAGGSPDFAGTSENAVSQLASEAESLGVTATPTLYRHGPASHIRLTEAALMGDTAATAATILSIADDDAIWGISKP